MFYGTMLFIGLVTMVTSTTRVGNAIITLRVVEPQVRILYFEFKQIGLKY